MQLGLLAFALETSATLWGLGGWNELGDWDGYIYTTGTMYKIDN